MQASEGERELLPLVAAAHELKAPLALLRQLLLRVQDDDLRPAEKAVLLERAILTSERGLRLTGDLTKAARLEDALFTLEPINPEQLCLDIAAEL